jgi:hypothetical protein
MRRVQVVFALTMAIGCVLAGSAQAVVLYDQTDHATDGSLTSTQYSDNSTCDNQVADDFTVPAGAPWNINEVDVQALNFASPEAGTRGVRTITSIVNVFIYADAGGLPGAQLYASPNTPASNPLNYNVPLAGVPPLSPGHYWISVQQAGASCQAEESWRWQLRDIANGSAAVTMSTFQGACDPTWTLITDTNCLDFSNPEDMVFKLLGTQASCPSPDISAAKFHPRRPVLPFVHGVRAKLSTSTPSKVDLDATLGYHAGGSAKTADLGHHSVMVSTFRKVRLALPQALRALLPRHTPVTFTLDMQITPLAAGCSAKTHKTLALATKVVNVQTSRLTP